VVYRTDTCTYNKTLAYHRESVQCLVRVNQTVFASASLDGTVVLWNTDALLQPMKVLNNPDHYRNEGKVYIYNVKFLLPLGDVIKNKSLDIIFSLFNSFLLFPFLKIRNIWQQQWDVGSKFSMLSPVNVLWIVKMLMRQK